MTIESLAAQDLLATVQDIKSAGFRLGQICATMQSPAENKVIEILYTFEKDNSLINYKTLINAGSPEIQSITSIYPYAFIYENEMHDLFGIIFKNLAPDYGGNFYKTAKQTPWNPHLENGGAR